MSIRKRWMSAMLAIIMLCTLCVQSVVAKEEKKRAEDGEVTVLFTHDLHSRLDEYKTKNRDYKPSLSSTFIKEKSEPAMAGGLSRLKTEIEAKKSENPATFLFDAGDFSMGTLYQTIYETDAAELTMLGRMGYDATTFGNHEFDYRAEGISNMFHSALSNAKEDESLTLPAFVIANIDWEKNHTEDNKLMKKALDDYGSTPYTIVEREGVRVGVYGVMGEDAEACAPESGLKFDSIVETSREVVKALKKENVDMIVCLSHSGTSTDPKKSEDEILAEEVPEIDVIVSGHTHTTLEEPIIKGDTVIVSSGCYGENLGELKLVPSDDGRWDIKDYNLKKMDDSVKKDQEIQGYLDEYKQIINEEYLSRFGYTMDQVLAVNPVEFTQMDTFATTLKEDTLGSIIADSYIYAVEKAEGEQYEQVDVAVVASGVIRDTFQEGSITVSDAFNVSALGIGADRITGYPLVSVYLTGEELKTAAEIDASISPIMTTAQLYPSGMKWVYNPNRLILNRVTEAYLTNKEGEGISEGYYDNLEEIQDEQLYRVVSGLYSAQMLGAVESQSKGILKITPKDRDGNKITDFEKHIIHNTDGAEVKEWYALASYLESFDTGSEGVSEVPAWYNETQGRKVEHDTSNIIELLKKPNKIALAVYGIIVVFIVLIVLLVRFIIKRKNRHRIP